MSIRVNEIFGPTIQGEGALIGQPTVFVRTGGCDYRCTWCDTLHAVDSKYRDEWKPMNAEDIFACVQELSKNTPMMVSLSGGNPAIHDLGLFITLGKKHGYTFNLETQGSIAQPWFKDLDVLTLSPKPPSSGMNTDWTKFDECLTAAEVSKSGGPQIVMKIVVFDDADYAYAKDAAARYPHLQLYLQPGNHTPPPQKVDIAGITQRLTWLGEKVANDSFNARVLPQLHVLMWGNARGV